MLRRRFSAGTVGVNYVINIDDYLTIEALEDGLTAKLSTNACEYCIDGNGVWLPLSANTETQSVNQGQVLSFRGNLTPKSGSGIGTFTISKKCNLRGNCMSMLFGDNAANSLSLSGKNYAFYHLFFGTNIIEVSENFLPATTLATSCYQRMFYSQSQLIKASKLPATTLATSCYQGMFGYCSKLKEAPELPADRLVSKCYEQMFTNCFGLRYIKALFLTTPGTSYTNNWVSSVNTTDGIFVKAKAATWDVTGVNGVPSSWTVITDDEEVTE